MYSQVVKLSDIQKSGSLSAADNIQVTLAVTELHALEAAAAKLRRALESAKLAQSRIDQILAAVAARNQQ